MPHIVKSTILEAPTGRVWDVLRDFNGHDRWHPAVATSQIERAQPSDKIGCVRRFKLKDGAELREQLLALSDLEQTFSYCLLDTPIPMFNYVAHVRLLPVTDGDVTVAHVNGVEVLVKRIPGADFASLQLYVRGGARDTPRRDRSAGASDVLDHDRLSKRAPHAISDDPRNGSGRTAHGERDDHGDRTRREVLRRHGHVVRKNGPCKNRYACKRRVYDFIHEHSLNRPKDRQSCVARPASKRNAPLGHEAVST